MAKNGSSRNQILGKRKSENTNVHTNRLSPAEINTIDDLTIKFKVPSQHGNARSICWSYFGHLYSSSKNVIIDEGRFYCRPCLNVEKTAGDKAHLSNIKNFSKTSYTGTMALHLSMKHNICESADKNQTMQKYLSKYASGECSKTLSNHELYRDITIWFCRDLIPFDTVEKSGMRDFFDKVLPDNKLPSRSTISCSALNDVYLAVHDKIKDMLVNVKSLCLMFDGWTDKYKARPYLGIRASFIQNWTYHIVTLGCHVLPVHTSQGIAEHVLAILSDFIPDVKQVLLSTCHDGAANMVKASKLLKVENYQHCMAHALHLLLTTDSLNTIEEISVVMQKCRNIVSAIHFKTVLLENEISSSSDRVSIDNLKERMNSTDNLLDLDDNFPVEDTSSNETEIDITSTGHRQQHYHRSLKMSCPTRWNSSLTMIESILDLRVEAMNVLKRIGKVELCLAVDEIDLLMELRSFLKLFESLTELVSTPTPSLAIVPLIKLHIRKSCKIHESDSAAVVLLKQKVLQKLPSRFPESDCLRVHQLLDPSTKEMITRENASELLLSVINRLSNRGYIVKDTDGDSEMKRVSTNKRKSLQQDLISEARQASRLSTDSNSSDVALEINRFLSYR